MHLISKSGCEYNDTFFGDEFIIVRFKFPTMGKSIEFLKKFNDFRPDFLKHFTIFREYINGEEWAINEAKRFYTETQFKNKFIFLIAVNGFLDLKGKHFGKHC